MRRVIVASSEIAIFRGTDARGYKNPKVTEGGVLGDGLYFYTDSEPAKSHATWPDGGVLTAYIKPSDCFIKDNVVVVKNLSKIRWCGKIPLGDTTLTGKAWLDRVKTALSEKG